MPPKPKLNRKEVADKLKLMAISYLVHLRYGAFVEVGITPWGKRRVDVVALKISGDIVICEIKSCKQDYTTDSKLMEYWPFCNRMYLVFPEKLDVEIPEGVGVMIPDLRTGYLKVIKSAKHHEMKGRDKRNLVMRLAWRAATHSKRTNPRRKRIWLEEKE